ncbi:Kinase, STE STE20 [Giardia muris]|uniref:Kinase, STE STE20 n=1 Tax=Giardia muris TaxID=5742 RepID=A0A4Z1T629_GIAMU|nr:Kinase, STE STE20 [Giardia muris]|eukprot:TNJ27911.1 Kinase, STE STE20 [Giardia muris]
MASFKPIANRYRTTQVLGRGAAGVVFKSEYTDPDTGQVRLCALKQLNLDRKNAHIAGIQAECKTLAQCHHPNIAEYHCSFVHRNSLWLVMSVMASNIQGVIRRVQPNGVDENIAMSVAHDILSALAYLEANNQIHRDVKTANILIKEDGTAVLADFGVAGVIMDGVDPAERHTFVGSPLYMAPEIIKNQSQTPKVDIWSLGICLIELVEGSPPYKNMDAVSVIKMIAEHDPPSLNNPSKYGKPFQELISRCLVKDPRDRASASDLLKRIKFPSKHQPGAIKTLLDQYFQKRQGGVSDNITDTEQERLVSEANACLQGANEVPQNDDTWDFHTSRMEVQEYARQAMELEGGGTGQSNTCQTEPEDPLNIAISSVEALVAEVQRLRKENADLKAANDKLIRRIRVFSKE